MIINFKYDDMDAILRQYADLLGPAEPGVIDEDEYLTVADGFRIVFPQIHVSFRTGIGYEFDELAAEIEDPNEMYNSTDWVYKDRPFMYLDGVFIMYGENERDYNKYEQMVGRGIEYLLSDICDKAGYPRKEIAQLDCYIDTSEFATEDEVQAFLKEHDVNK